MSGATIAAARVRSRSPVQRVSGEAIVRTVVATLTAAAGVVHLVHATTHLRPTLALGVGFLAVGWAQLLIGALVLTRRDRGVLVAAAVVDLVAVGAWALSRTIGLPLIGGIEPVGAADGFTAAIAFVAAVGAVRLLAARPIRWRARASLARPAGWVAALVLVATTTASLLGGAHLHDPAHHATGSGGVAVEPGHDVFGHPLDGTHEHDLFPQLDD